MKLFKALKQPDIHTCLPTCLAMIIDESVEYVLDWFRHMGQLSTGYEAVDAIIFLAHHGIYLATYAKSTNDGDYFELTGKKKY